MAVMTPAEVISRQLDVPKPGRYRISPAQSTVTIRTRHFFGLGAVRATLALRDGRIVVTDPPEASTVQARFAVPSFSSGNEARDAAVLSPRLLDAEAFPSAMLRASAQVSIDRHDFGITAYRGLAARRLTVGLGIVAHREES
jgi:polyisoprenoid-binding protein YceI